MGQASDTYAKITREQYDNWYERFYPKQKQLLQSTQNGSLLNEQLGRVDGNFKSANVAAQTANSNQLGRYGLSDTSQGDNEAQQSLAVATSKNSLREYEKDRSLGTLSGSNVQSLNPINND